MERPRRRNLNRHLDALRSAVTFWMDQGRLNADPTRRLRRRRRAPDRTRALAVADIDVLFDLGAPLREKTLWTTLYETAARASEILGLDIEDLALLTIGGGLLLRDDPQLVLG